MRVCNLGSGSDGNLTYIESARAKVLLDVGFSASEVTKRLALLQVAPEEIDAILITHEHLDHIKGLNVFASKYQIPVYIHTKGYYALISKLKNIDKIKFVQFDDLDFYIKDIQISNYCLSHDSEYCSGYSFVENSKKVSILTDLGYTNSEVLSKISGSTLVYLESNHDVDMLKNNPHYPLMLKQRILGRNGHLSNISAAEVIKKLVDSGTKQIMLSHLSTENNSPLINGMEQCSWMQCMFPPKPKEANFVLVGMSFLMVGGARCNNLFLS